MLCVLSSLRLDEAMIEGGQLGGAAKMVFLVAVHTDCVADEWWPSYRIMETWLRAMILSCSARAHRQPAEVHLVVDGPEEGDAARYHREKTR